MLDTDVFAVAAVFAAQPICPLPTVPMCLLPLTCVLVIPSKIQWYRPDVDSAMCDFRWQSLCSRCYTFWELVVLILFVVFSVIFSNHRIHVMTKTAANMSIQVNVGRLKLQLFKAKYPDKEIIVDRSIMFCYRLN